MAETETPTHPEGYSPFVPMAIIVLLLLVLVGTQLLNLSNQREALEAAKASQEQPLANAQKIQAQLTALARGTAFLAQQGNKNALLIQDELAKRGVQIKP